MRVKHFAGYGSVEAKKVLKKTFTDRWGNKKTKLVVFVKGNHEWGLVCATNFDVKSWLFDKFEKHFSGEYYDIEMSIESNYIKEKGLDVETATYTFIY